MDIAIGELSRRAGVKVPTIRYYEGVGLMPPAPRSEGRQRRYDESHVTRLNFIRHARELGFEVDAIRELLALSADPDRPCGEVDVIARRHMAAVEHRIRQLTAMKKELRRMIEGCGQGRVGECRVIETLADSSHEHGRLASD